MSELKYTTLQGDGFTIRYRIDKRGKPVLVGRKVRRSKDDFTYELSYSVNGGFWQFSGGHTTREGAKQHLLSLAA